MLQGRRLDLQHSRRPRRPDRGSVSGQGRQRHDGWRRRARARHDRPLHRPGRAGGGEDRQERLARLSLLRRRGVWRVETPVLADLMDRGRLAGTRAAAAIDILHCREIDVGRWRPRPPCGGRDGVAPHKWGGGLESLDSAGSDARATALERVRIAPRAPETRSPRRTGHAKRPPMRILLTNDDGIHAQGLKLLESIAHELSDDVTVVAPESDQSGVAHSLSLSDPLRLREIGPRHFALKGTPTDCVIMGVRRILAGRPPDLVLSGVNRGQNVAEDVTYSGTIAGAMEGALLGIPSIALSQAYGGAVGRPIIEWDAAETHAAPVIRTILAAGIAPGGLVNINFPACAAAEVAGVELTRQGRRNAELMRVEERRDGRGFPYFWLMFQRGAYDKEEGTDLAALAQGRISVTPLRLDLTDNDSRMRFEEAFARSGEAT